MRIFGKVFYGHKNGIARVLQGVSIGYGKGITTDIARNSDKYAYKHYSCCCKLCYLSISGDVVVGAVIFVVNGAAVVVRTDDDDFGNTSTLD